MRTTLVTSAGLGLAALLAALPAPAAPPAVTDVLGPVADSRAVDLRSLPQLPAIIPALVEQRVVFVGESHDQYAHHLVQLAIIRAMHRHDPNLAIGLEFFQTPFQEYLDRYVAEAIDEQEMLEQTEYFSRWSYDYRLYRPILEYAREHGIPLVALNVPAELTHQVAEGGLASLSEEQRSQLPPEMGEADEAYRARLRPIFQQHPGSDERDFERFVQAQLLWDEGMAARAAEYLRAHPDTRMVILAGSGHIAHRTGIPQRLARRTGIDGAVVVNGLPDELAPTVADFVVLPPPQELPPKGMLGILMEEREGGIVVEGFVDGSPARAAGLQEGDRLVSLRARPIDTITDVKLALLGAAPGEVVQVEVLRPHWLGADELRSFEVTLSAPDH